MSRDILRLFDVSEIHIFIPLTLESSLKNSERKVRNIMMLVPPSYVSTKLFQPIPLRGHSQEHISHPSCQLTRFPPLLFGILSYWKWAVYLPTIRFSYLALGWHTSDVFKSLICRGLFWDWEVKFLAHSRSSTSELKSSYAHIFRSLCY